MHTQLVAHVVAAKDKKVFKKNREWFEKGGRLGGMIQYNTIRYIYVRSKADKMVSLV